MRHTVVGLFDNKNDAREAMNDLVKNGFIKEDIDLSNRRFAGEGTTGKRASVSDEEQGLGDRIGNFFSSLFGNDTDTARNYTNAASDAEAILTVQVDSKDRAEKAQEIFDRHDSMDVDERTAQYGRHAAAGVRGKDKDQTIPVVEERMKVGKRQVESGGARIRSRIIEKPVEENIRLREEHVVVNRRPVDRELTDADMRNFRPGEMEITERAEVPVVGKEARVVEEVEVSKDVSERDETVRDKVRKTDVKVERFGKEDRGSRKPPQPRA